MKIIIQRVSEASVSVRGEVVATVKKGFLVFLGFCRKDKECIIEKAVKRIIKLRVFEDERGKMNRNIQEEKGEVLLVSQFTLCADLESGNRPGFDNAMDSQEAEVMFEKFFISLSSVIPSKKGVFGEFMEVRITNNGPATFIMEIE